METELNKIIDATKIATEQWKLTAQNILADGGVVAFPTETVYGLAADIKSKSGLEKLNLLKKRPENKPYTIHINDRKRIKQFVPNPPWFAQILSLKGWPGPITIVIKLEEQQINLCKQKFNELFDDIYRDNSIGLRCPSHPIAQKLLDNPEQIIVAPSANPSGKPPACDAQEILNYFNDDIDLILDAGPTKFQKPSTVVKVTKNSYEIVREGVLDKRAIDKLTTFNVMFVCTGNTCRSPMAEAWFSKLLAEYINCDENHLQQLKINISSAGTFASYGSAASELAIKVMKEHNIDISNHRSQPITRENLLAADIIFVMTEEHKDFIVSILPEVENRIKLISEKGIHDPIGGTEQEYSNSCLSIKQAVEKRIKELFQ